MTPLPESQSLSNDTVTRLQEAYVEKVIDTVNDRNNVLYENTRDGISLNKKNTDNFVSGNHIYGNTTGAVSINVQQQLESIRIVPSQDQSPLKKATALWWMPPPFSCATCTTWWGRFAGPIRTSRFRPALAGCA